MPTTPRLAQPLMSLLSVAARLGVNRAARRLVILVLTLGMFAGRAGAQDPDRQYAKAGPLPDLTGKVALITGSTDGLGRDVARRMAAAGARVLITGRSKARGDSLVQEITRSGKGSARFYEADLASLAETRRLAAAVARDNPRLHYLINNAGVGFVFDSTRKFSADGYEMHFAVNYLAHYLLTKELLPVIAAAAPARIINVSSGSQAPIDFDDVMMDKGFTGGRGYAQSKLAQVMMTIDMAPALEKQGILTYSLHPATTMNTTMARALNVKPRSTIAEGVESVVNAIITTEPTGTYFNQLRPVQAQAQAYDAEARARLRAVSERLIAGGAGASQGAPLDGFDQHVQAALAALEHPGLAIAVVKDDSVVYAKGFGVREVGKPGAVDAHTLFAIGSSTKAFTGASVAMMVDQGKMSWDEPLSTYLPGFVLKDPYVSSALTVRDALTHRSGLARTDLVWISGQFEGDELIRRLRFVDPAGGFRASYGYQNLMFLAAGMAAARAAGLPTWQDFVTQKILGPLGMTESNVSVTALAGKANVARPHALIDDTLRAIGARNVDRVAPAGAINSNVTDMAKWVRFQLAGGKAGGKQLVAERVLAETRTPQFTLRRSGQSARDGHFSAYGMGWFLEDYRGRFVVHHGGNIDGMTAMVAMMPDENLGVVVLANMNGSPLPGALAYDVFDRFTGLERRDRVGEIRQGRERAQARAAEQAKAAEAKRVKGTTPSLPLPAYAGVYADSANGEMRITVEDGKLVLRYGTEFTGDLEHWNFDTFKAVWRRSALLRENFVSFELGRDGAVRAVSVDQFGDFGRRP